jgi:hypothetical protein
VADRRRPVTPLSDVTLERGLCAARFGLELDVRLREQPAVQELRIARRVLLHQRHHDTQPAASELIPVRAAEGETAS